MSMVNAKRRREVPDILLFLLALVVLTGPTPPAQFAADEGGGRAELEEVDVIWSGSVMPVRV